MSDLSASHCGCSGNSPQSENNGCCNSIIWIIILFFLCGNGNGIMGGNGGCNGNGILGGRDNGCGCEVLIVLILLFSCCGNNNY